mmetsp:Transcript_26970/g.86544  ORF Transcript_26970/g.86544 Transcript_26970/m.86544 type:complete len:203 (-) Transcript_26970:259-867(-)
MPRPRRSPEALRLRPAQPCLGSRASHAHDVREGDIRQELRDVSETPPGTGSPPKREARRHSAQGAQAPMREATAALPNVLRRRPARLPWVGGCICVRSPLGSARLGRAQAVPPLLARLGGLLECGRARAHLSSHRLQDGALLSKLALQLRILLVDLLQRAPHRLHVSPPGKLGRLIQHQRRLFWSGDQAARTVGKQRPLSLE